MWGPAAFSRPPPGGGRSRRKGPSRGVPDGSRELIALTVGPREPGRSAAALRPCTRTVGGPTSPAAVVTFPGRWQPLRQPAVSVRVVLISPSAIEAPMSASGATADIRRTPLSTISISISPIPEPYGVVGSAGDGDHGRAFAADATSAGRRDDHRPDVRDQRDPPALRTACLLPTVRPPSSLTAPPPRGDGVLASCFLSRSAVTAGGCVLDGVPGAALSRPARPSLPARREESVGHAGSRPAAASGRLPAPHARIVTSFRPLSA